MKTISKEQKLKEKIKALKQELEQAKQDRINSMHSQMWTCAESAVDAVSRAKAIADEYGFQFDIALEEGKTITYSRVDGGWRYPLPDWID